MGWGLFRLRDWARFAATLIFGIGIAWAVSMIFLAKQHLGWRLLGACMEIAIRAIAIAYLLAPSVMDSFGPKMKGSVEIR
jgi:hypothetical protein